MKKLFLILLITFILVPVARVHADDIDIYRHDGTDVEPNALILFDTSGSMLTILPVSGYDPFVDYSTPLLAQGKQVVFSRYPSGCYPTHHRVTYQTTESNVLLKYYKANSTTNLCSGSGWQTYRPYWWRLLYKSFESAGVSLKWGERPGKRSMPVPRRKRPFKVSVFRRNLGGL